MPEDLRARKAELDAVGGVEAFPFDETLDVRMVSRVDGLEKLRYVADRGIAKMLYEMFWQAEALGRAEWFKRQRELERRKERAEELEWLDNVAKSSLAGAFGVFIRREAQDHFGNDSDTGTEAQQRAWLDKIRRLDWRGSADATKRIAR